MDWHYSAKLAKKSLPPFFAGTLIQGAAMIMVLMAFSLPCGTLMGFRLTFLMRTFGGLPLSMLAFGMLSFRMRAFKGLQGVVEPASFGLLSGLAYHGL